MTKNKTLSRKFLSVSLSFFMVATVFVMISVVVPEKVRAEETPDPPFDALQIISEHEVVYMREEGDIFVYDFGDDKTSGGSTEEEKSPRTTSAVAEPS